MLATDFKLDAQAAAPSGSALNEAAIRSVLEEGLGQAFAGARVLALIPDHTRTLPMPLLFRLTTEVLANVRRLDFMVALGTHPPLSEEALCSLVGITAAERSSRYRSVGLFNHNWNNSEALVQLGTLTQDQVRQIAGPYWHNSLSGDVPIRINRAALEYDHILILGPTFPHEVAGFSGGAKYLFPGISGPEIINVTHWLGALITIPGTIGIAHTPVRDMIHEAAALLSTPVKLVGLVVEGSGLAGIFVGHYREAFEAAARLSSERHIRWIRQPFRRVLSAAPPMYDELWVAAKAMYKVEPVVEDGGEIVIYAPHLNTVSRAHGRHIYDIGYHVRDYFLKQWEKFKDIPLGALAHSTHLRGSGSYENGVEQPRIRVALASALSADDCRTLNLGYVNPADIQITDWQNREDSGILYVPKAGETLYRLAP